MRRGENPLLVYERFCVKLKKIQKSIKLINKSRNVGEKILPVQLHDQLEALTGIFVRKNNSEQYNNKHVINELTVDYIVKKHPKTLLQ